MVLFTILRHSTCKPYVEKYCPGQKNRHSRDIHEIDPQCDHVISCNIDFDLQRELATRSAAGRVDVEPKPDITRSHC